MTTRVTIHDEGTRRTVECALWMRAAEVVGGETFHNELYDAALEVIGVDDIGEIASSDCADERLADLCVLREDITRVQTAELGEFLELSITADGLRTTVENCRVSIEESAHDGRVDGGFFAQEPKVRDVMLATRDAAVRLLAELQPAAEAVA